jgi:hypothetical protein
VSGAHFGPYWGKITEGSTRRTAPVAQNGARDALGSVHRVINLLNPEGETPRPGLA